MDQVGITANLWRNLQTKLAACGPFDSDIDLQNAFTDARIARWRKSIPSAPSPIKRVNALIALLLDEYNISKENGLVLFLHVVSEHADAESDCCGLLEGLANELEEEIVLQQLTGLSDADLLALSTRFSCDYAALSGRDQKEKVFGMIKQLKRQGQMAVLKEAARNASLSSLPEQAQTLQSKISQEANADIRETFGKFAAQVQSYLDELHALHDQLDEWKEVHNLLQDLQNEFARCRGFVFILDNLEQTPDNRQRDKWLYEIEVEWRPCQRTLRNLQHLATGLRMIGIAYDEKAHPGPEWYIAVRQAALQISEVLNDHDIQRIANCLSAFADTVDTHLYLADKNLRDVVKRINQIPRPSVL